ncbi:MAG TPA: hypothetical protein VLN47_07460 [Clostridiaceae bacterium]|nr:hypothetical protein [Clostridiaceae bacterium]
MDSSSWIAIYLPLFIIFFVVLPQQQHTQMAITRKNKRRKGLLTMTNEMLKKYIGKTCMISTGSMGSSVKGRILDVSENWVEVETNKGIQVVNAEFIMTIKMLGDSR